MQRLAEWLVNCGYEDSQMGDYMVLQNSGTKFRNILVCAEIHLKIGNHTGVVWECRKPGIGLEVKFD